jgi:hypothetical protein
MSDPVVDAAVAGYDPNEGWKSYINPTSDKKPPAAGDEDVSANANLYGDSWRGISSYARVKPNEFSNGDSGSASARDAQSVSDQEKVLLQDTDQEFSGYDWSNSFRENIAFRFGNDDPEINARAAKAYALSGILGKQPSMIYEYGGSAKQLSDILSRVVGILNGTDGKPLYDPDIADMQAVREGMQNPDGRYDYLVQAPTGEKLIAGGSFPQQPEGRNPFQNIYEAKRRSRAELSYEELQARLASDWMREGMSKEAAMAEAYGHTSAQTEAYDPISLFAGGLGAGYRLGNTAASVGERLFRAGLQSAVMTAADIPISGMITPAIEEKYPGLALPANLILSIISGVSIEKGAEKGLIKLIKSKGIVNAGAAAAEIKAGLAEKARRGELGPLVDKALEEVGSAEQKAGLKATEANATAPAEGIKAEGQLGGNAVSAVEKEGPAEANALTAERSPTISTEKIDGVNFIKSSKDSRIGRAYDIVMQYLPRPAKDLFDARTTDVETAIEKGERFYREELMNNPVHAPAFDGDSVKFTLSGFLHIATQDGRKLTIESIKRRISLLMKAREVLRTTPFVDDFRPLPNGDKIYGLLGRFEDGTVIRVAVKETSEEGKVFRTVYDWSDVSRKVQRSGK